MSCAIIDDLFNVNFSLLLDEENNEQYRVKQDVTALFFIYDHLERVIKKNMNSEQSVTVNSRF